MDFVSFLLERSGQNKIKRIILFGSVARNEADGDSDVDIFIDLFNKDKKVKNKIDVIRDEFLRSKRYEGYWLLKDIKNEIRLTIGKLDEWRGLKNSIISNGILLYGQFEEMPKGSQHKTLLIWENIKPESKRVMLMKRLFGYKKENKRYEGMVQKYGGERLGKGIIAVNPDVAKIFQQHFKKMKIAVKIKKILEYK